MYRVESELKANTAMTVIDRFLDDEGAYYAPPEMEDHSAMRREKLVQALASEIERWKLPQETIGWHCEPVIEVGHPVEAWMANPVGYQPDLRVPAETQPVIIPPGQAADFEAAAVEASRIRKREGLWRVHRMASEPVTVRTIPTYAVVHVASPAQESGLEPGGSCRG